MTHKRNIIIKWNWVRHIFKMHPESIPREAIRLALAGNDKECRDCPLMKRYNTKVGRGDKYITGSKIGRYESV